MTDNLTTKSVFSEEQIKDLEEWHKNLFKCGCGRVARYETATGSSCNKYLRCDNAGFLANRVKELEEVLVAAKEAVEANHRFRTINDPSKNGDYSNGFYMGSGAYEMNATVIHKINKVLENK